jgi:hypothetical protein
MGTSAVFRRRAGLLPALFVSALFVSALSLSGCGGSAEVEPAKAQEALKTSSQESAGAFFQNKASKKKATPR